jgi:hypothetical protein
MKSINPHRLLTATLLFLFIGFASAFADGAIQKENKEQGYSAEQNLNKVNINDVFCQNNPNQVFIIMDHYDRIIQQGRCNDEMIKFFLKISDPLFQIDDIRYYRLGYENPEIMEQRLILNHEYALKD